MNLSKKVIIIGHFGVGKTSLVRRFVHAEFSEDYITTIGVKVDKKIVDYNGAPVSLLLWDIAGESSVVKVPDSYKLGAHGVVYVFDCSRPATYEGIEDDLASLKQTLPNASMVVVGNKSDLLDENNREKLLTETNLQNVLFTSAKEGAGVEDMFVNLTSKMLT